MKSFCTRSTSARSCKSAFSSSTHSSNNSSRARKSLFKTQTTRLKSSSCSNFWTRTRDMSCNRAQISQRGLLRSKASNWSISQATVSRSMITLRSAIFSTLCRRTVSLHICSPVKCSSTLTIIQSASRTSSIACETRCFSRRRSNGS